MPRLRHIALVVKDLEKSAQFYESVFGFERAGEETLEFASAIYLTDGTINMALLNYRGKNGHGLEKITGRLRLAFKGLRPARKSDGYRRQGEACSVQPHPRPAHAPASRR